MFLEAIVVKLKVGGAHSLGLHPERPLRWLSMSQVSESLGSIRVLMLQTMACYKRQTHL